jgi:excisionase family DNA binding protein
MLKVGSVTLISMAEAVKRFGISDETLRRAIRQKQLQAIRASGRTFFKPEDVRRWKERYYYPSKADAVRVRWAKQKQKAKTRGRVKTKRAA